MQVLERDCRVGAPAAYVEVSRALFFLRDAFCKAPRDRGHDSPLPRCFPPPPRWGTARCFGGHPFFCTAADRHITHPTPPCRHRHPVAVAERPGGIRRSPAAFRAKTATTTQRRPHRQCRHRPSRGPTPRRPPRPRLSVEWTRVDTTVASAARPRAAGRGHQWSLAAAGRCGAWRRPGRRHRRVRWHGQGCAGACHMFPGGRGGGGRGAGRRMWAA